MSSMHEVTGRRYISSLQDCAWIVAEAARRKSFDIDGATLERATSELLQHAAKVGQIPDLSIAVIPGAARYRSSSANLSRQAYGLLPALYPAGTDLGSVVAIPHGGPYLAAALGLIRAAPPSRTVTFTFDGEVAARFAQTGDAGFHDLFDPSPDRPPVVALDVRGEGVATAVRCLRSGGIIVIFADIVSDLRRALTVPWLGGARTVMPGAAWLSLASQARLFAAAPVASHQGEVDVLWEEVSAGGSRPPGRLATYNLTLDLWEAFERLHAAGAIQLRDTYEIFRPAPLRDLFDAAATANQLVEVITTLAAPFPELGDAAPALTRLPDQLGNGFAHSAPRSGPRP